LEDPFKVLALIMQGAWNGSINGGAKGSKFVWGITAKLYQQNSYY